MWLCVVVCLSLGKAVEKKVQELILQSAYTDDNKTYKFVRQVLSLTYVPDEHVEEPLVRLDFIERQLGHNDF